MGRKIEGRSRGKAVKGVEISVIWSRRRDAWTYLGGADAGEEKRGFSYPERRPRTGAAYRNESNYSQGR